MIRSEDDITKERWALRVMTVSPVTYGNAGVLIHQFHSAGGNQELFDKLERVALEKGHDFAKLIGIIVDCKLIARKPLPRETIQRFVSQVNSLNVN